MSTPKSCLMCGASIFFPRVKYCSDLCYGKADREAKKLSLRRRGLSSRGRLLSEVFTSKDGQCEICHADLPKPRLNHQRFCSKRCYKKHTKRRDHFKDIKDPRRKAQDNLHSRLTELIKKRGLQKVNALYPYLGCSGPELLAHIERQWEPGMIWENRSATTWNIDHIIPYSLFDLQREDHKRICLHHLNLRPVWAKQNVKKGDSLDLSIIPEPLKSKAYAIGILHNKPYLERIKDDRKTLEQGSFAF